jgi:hypothetical protein
MMPEKPVTKMQVDATYRERAVARSMDRVILSVDTQPGGLPAVAMAETVVLDTDESDKFDFRPEDN